ncbi:MAG: type II toxin-antitoxin system VapC family toxin [Methylococcales bacterium]|nr:type II toxin-antitoxin system VapC family toxin [Methylococcales bacterium]
MIAVDTNILVRYAANDEPIQSQQAKALLKNAEAIFISKTTLLEFEWVLRSAYQLPRESILRSILTICGLPNLAVENAWQVSQACDLYSKGLDFADALHYSANTCVEKFYTFDEKFIRSGKLLNLKISKPDAILD